MRRFPPWATLGLFTLLAHGLILPNDGVYSADDWVHVYLPRVQNDWPHMLWAMDVWGYPIRAYQHWLAGYGLGVVAGHRLWTLVFIGLTAFFTYGWLRRLNLLPAHETLWLVLLSLAFPAYQTAVTLSVLPYHQSYAALMAALWLISIPVTGWRQHVAVRLSVYTLLGVAFWIQSLLAFYYGLLLAVFWSVHPPATWGGLWGAIRAFVLFSARRLDYGLAPLLFWAVSRALFPVEAALGTYYDPTLNEGMLNSLLFFAQNSLYAQVDDMLRALLATPVLGLGLVLGLWGVYRFAPVPPRETPRPAPPSALVLAIYALILFVLGALPYASLQMFPAVHGWSTRHALLVGLAVGVGGLALLRGLFGGQPRLQQTLLVGALACGLGALWNDYIGWQASWIQDRAMMHDLAALPPQARTAGVVWYDERLDWAENYRDHFTPTPLLTHTWGAQTYQAYIYDNTSPPLRSPLYDRLFYRRDFDPAACQAVWTVERGAGWPNTFKGEWGMVGRYWLFRALGARRLEAFLDGLLATRWRLITAEVATHCPAQAAFVAAGGVLIPADWPRHLALLQAALDAEKRGEALPVADSGLLIRFAFDAEFYNRYRYLASEDSP